MNEKDLELHGRIVLYRDFIEKHSFEDCLNALKTEIQQLRDALEISALEELEKFKPRDVKS